MGTYGAYRRTQPPIMHAPMPIALTIAPPAMGEVMVIRLRCWLRGMIALAGAALLFLFFAFANPLGAAAANVIVNSNGDFRDLGPCATVGTGNCTLREAITFANNNDNTTITFNLSNPALIVLTGAIFDPMPPLTRTTGTGTTIIGPGAAALIVAGECDVSTVCSPAAPVLTVNSGVTASISGLTIQGGSAVAGGGLNNAGTLTVSNSIITNNGTGNSGGDGGGIFNSGTLVVTNSTISGNRARTGNGGGIANTGTLVVTNSTFASNTASGTGGGINNGSGATLTVKNSTFANNAGGGIKSGGSLTLRNTIVTGGVNGSFTGSNNLIDDFPLLGALANYGGLTPTIPLLPGSPAIDTGDDATCSATTGTAPVNNLDQRGIPRNVGTHCDIGAFESQGFSLAKQSGDQQKGVIDAPFANPLVVTVSSSHNEPVSGGQVTFTAPLLSGPSAINFGDPTTDGSGQSRITPTANHIAGGPYTVTASVLGSAVSFTLTNVLASPVVNRTGDGVAVVSNCIVGNANTCRLRDAMAIEPSQSVTGNAIVTFALPAPSTITLDSVQGPLIVASTFTGPGASALTISGNNTGPIMVAAGDTSISGVTLAGGMGTGNGAYAGGITNQVNLVITNVTFTGNGGPVSGGAIVNTGTLTLTGCTFSNNTVVGNGGAIDNRSGGTVTVTNSTFSGNHAIQGGAIANENGGTLTVTNSTFSGNVVGNTGGGLYNLGTMMVTNSTLTGNNADATGGGGGIATFRTLTVTNSTLTGNYGGQGGGGIIKFAGTLSVTNSIIAGNTATFNPDLDGSASGGHNLIGGTPRLGTLGNYGGTTQTIPLLPGSPALDAGDDATCAATGSDAVSNLDQRGITRPQGAHCDIGSVEARFTLTASGGTPQSANFSTAFATPLAVTLTSPDGISPLSGAIVTFTPPVSGASATLASSPATTNASGGASVTATANGTVGTYSVTASTPGASAVTFALTNAGLTGIGPAAGSTGGGNTVTLTGVGFGTAATTQVLLDGTAIPTANITSVTGTQIVYTAPAHAAGNVSVTVTVGGTTLAGSATYTYGVVNALPGGKPTGGTPGSPNPLPGSRPTVPTGPTSGTAPNSLPAARP